MVDLEVEKLVKELRGKDNSAGIEAVLRIALYYTEKIASMKLPGSFVAEKVVDKDDSKPEVHFVSDVKTELGQDSERDVDFEDALKEEEKKLGIHQ